MYFQGISLNTTYRALAMDKLDLDVLTNHAWLAGLCVRMCCECRRVIEREIWRERRLKLAHAMSGTSFVVMESHCIVKMIF